MTTSINALTEVESQILKLLCKGFLQKEISKKIHMPRRTVVRQIDNMKKKFDCFNTIHLVAFAYENGLLNGMAQNTTHQSEEAA